MPRWQGPQPECSAVLAAVPIYECIAEKEGTAGVTAGQ
jgi:hypothetical protein